VPDGVDTFVNHVQPPRSNSPIDRLFAEAEGQQLAPSDHPELPSGNSRDDLIDWALSTSHTDGERRPAMFFAPRRTAFLLGGRF
jgi:hypothetical protein